MDNEPRDELRGDSLDDLKLYNEVGEDLDFEFSRK